MVPQFLTQILNDLGVFGGWLLWLLSNPGWVFMAIIGWIAINWAWKEGKSWAAIPKWYFALALSILLALIMFFGLGLFFRLAPQAGEYLLHQIRAGGQEATLPEAPNVGEKEQPLFATGDQQPQPTSQSQTFTQQQPTPGSSTSTGGVVYVVSDPTGATMRYPGSDNVCQDDDATMGQSIPFGTEVTIVGTWSSAHTENGISQRGLTSTGSCVHLGALTIK